MTSLNHTHPAAFTPTANNEKGWANAISASQHPRVCSRFLLVEDDLTKQGLGFTFTFWASALLVAVRAGRVLLEVPLDNSWPHPAKIDPRTNLSTSSLAGPRWCAVPPYTFQCFYAEWSHCLPPANTSLHEAPTTRQKRKDGDPKYYTMVRLPPAPAVLRMKLSWFRVSLLGWVSDNAAKHAAIRFLTRPRSWVRRAADCVMGSSGLQRNAFVSVFIRDSVEKRAELAGHGHGMPRQSAYELLTARITNQLGWRHVHLSTSSAASLSAFRMFANRSRLVVAATENPRSQHDSWGGWGGVSQNDTVTLNTAVAIVNQHVASQAGTCGRGQRACTQICITHICTTYKCMCESMCAWLQPVTSPSAVYLPSAYWEREYALRPRRPTAALPLLFRGPALLPFHSSPAPPLHFPATSPPLPPFCPSASSTHLVNAFHQ